MQRVTRSGVQWLTRAAVDGEECRNLWRHNPRAPYALPVGEHFEVLVVGQELGMETFGQLRRRRMPAGPVLADWAARQIGFMLPPRSRGSFHRVLAGETSTPPAFRYLDADAVLVVPGPLTLSGDRYEWLCPPVGEGGPSSGRTTALAVMLAASADLIARAAHIGEVELHEAR
ncbi:bifunctional DNA primase/polymerase [Streptomyces sp. NBC_00669]|uniref:bifunctional DNA primase/polymerase n=1 Tax=Streptomyces sp. NBC_00669 TaxID=2976011 RepID=UPI002E32E964|nr:bifunctional DNA primase/polymerase [Streptomyces sp. NBC_00669]